MTRTLALAPLVLLLGACPSIFGETDTDPSSSGSSDPTTTTTTTTTGSPSTTFMLVCTPGEERCADDATVETCKASGLGWDASPCSQHQTCQSGECIGPCEKVSVNPNSVGCEFVAIRMNSFNEGEASPDALIVGNTDTKLTAKVQLYFVPNGSHKEDPLGDPVDLPPGESHIFEMYGDTLPGYTALRPGGVFRVVSDIPITAYLHSTLENKASNDSSMLLPVHTLRKDYVIASYPGFADKTKPEEINGRPSYFTVIALEDDTTLNWTPKFATAGNNVPIGPVLGGETGTVKLNRFDVLQIGSSSLTNMNYFTHDTSGTLLEADKPISVMGATNCAFVPFDTGYCNHLQEQMLPLEYWGKTYVGAHSPIRATEKHYWRIFAGDDNATITTDPQIPGTPFLLAKRGDFKDLEVESGVSTVFQGTKRFLPVQYLAGYNSAGKIGDPAMYQMVPVEQWLDRYVVVTGVNYDLNYAQVIRRFGGADVTINGQVVTGYYLLNTVSGGKYEVADVQLQDGDTARTYLVESADAFSVIIVGYKSATPTSAYAYPGGMKLDELEPA